ncbi:uncharacterized protein [Miscanthus floridulus]|uniref:uncharacterized protein isoform X1 n=1 Tax=Miscanthus floridulus TaxID=154761 RepID=UPI00345AD6FC
MAMRSAVRQAILSPPLGPRGPGPFLCGRSMPVAPRVEPCRAASSATAPAAGKHLPPLFSVAPMMDWTDNHYRTLARLISRHAWLYTEMVVAETIVHQKDNLDRFLAFPEEQHPIVLQIGGSNLENLAKATELANGYSYDEINLNCGCPSGKVAGHGCFGARLMFDPEFVGDAMSTIAANCDVPVSVKCRIGVDGRDSYEELCEFVDKVVSKSPTRHFIIHARKALLSGLSPAENRKVPPLKYEYYFALLRDFPEIKFTLNGGITNVGQVSASIRQGAHGVMVGRAAYNNPWNMLGHVDGEIYGKQTRCISRRQILESYQAYGDSIIDQYGPSRPNVRQLVKPLLNLFHSEPGNSLWKRKADSALRHCKTVKTFLEETLDAIPDSVLDKPVNREPSSDEGYFANVDSLLPPKYTTPINCSYERLELVAAST